MKSFYLSGDPTYPLFHPYQNVSAALESLFGDMAQLTISEHYESLEVRDYRKYDLVIYYTDHWIDKTCTSHQQVQAAVNYIALGGSMLILHNPDIGVDRELAQIIGARLRHPLKDPGGLHPIRFLPVGDHPIVRGVEPFTCTDERFPVEYSPFTQRSVFLNGMYPDGTSFEAGWLVRFGLGRVVYLSPGHTKEAFEEPAYRKLIAQAAQWLTQEEPR